MRRMVKDKKNSLKYEVLNGNNEIIFSGYADEVLAFLENPACVSAFWVRQEGDDKKVRDDTWLFLARIVAKSVKKIRHQK